jgi:hypothetical protein
MMCRARLIWRFPARDSRCRIWSPEDASIATALARRHRTDSLGRVEVTDRDDMPLGLHDPRAEARRTEAVLDPSAVGGVHEAAGQQGGGQPRSRTR